MAKRSITPAYIQVAIDVAARISRNEIKKNVKISGRTTLSSEYNVSPETIRKAMRLLADMKIVEVKHGNGIYVASAENAEQFIERYKARVSINELKEKMQKLISERDNLEDKMNETVLSIIDYTSRFKNSEHIAIYEDVVSENSYVNGKSIEELKVWQNTGATIVGIKRDGKTILSPGPYETLNKRDRILYVGDVNCCIRLSEYLREFK